ncbi:MAG: tetratricopeptide repeat protein [Pseudomonadota bacterium]|nr:tetratricopeptide repeat protein [Pseudomonadota bacterium]
MNHHTQSLARSGALDALRRGDHRLAIRLLDAALSSSHDDPELHYLRGMAHLRSRAPQQAIADLSRALRLSPDNPAVLFNRALAYHAQDATDEALADFKRVSQLQPGVSDAHANAGILLLRMERHAEAVESLRTALQLAPGNLAIRRSLGNALQGAGQSELALQALAHCEQHAGHDPATLTDHGMVLLANHRPEEARLRFQRALSLSALDQTALAGLYLSANALADTAALDRLMDHRRLLGSSQDAGQRLDMAALREATLTHPSLRWEPAGRSTRNGQQSVMLDLVGDGEFAAYRQMIEQHVVERIATIRNDPDLNRHPWASHAPARWHLQSWATVLHHDGHQSPHIHPAGWMSGVFYLDQGDAEDVGDGQLIFGHPPASQPCPSPREHVHTPVSGQLLSFPSYYFHHTRPYRGDRPRISLAFDVIPAA